MIPPKNHGDEACGCVTQTSKGLDKIKNFKGRAMTVQDINEFDQYFCKTYRNDNIQGMEAYAQKTNERIGTVSDVLEGKKSHSCYFVLDLDAQVSTKKVLLPADRSQIDHEAGFVYVIGLSREQARYLPEFKESRLLDCDEDM